MDGIAIGHVERKLWLLCHYVVVVVVSLKFGGEDRNLKTTTTTGFLWELGKISE